MSASSSAACDASRLPADLVRAAAAAERSAPREQAAAAKTAVHAATPVGRLRRLARSNLPHGRAQPVRAQRQRSSRRITPPASCFDIEGNQREVDRRQRPASSCATTTTCSARRIHSGQHGSGRALDAERRGGQADLRLGQPRSRSSAPTYDALRRPLESFLRDGDGRELLVGRTVYGESQPRSRGQQPARQGRSSIFDQAGVVTSDDVRLQGQPARAAGGSWPASTRPRSTGRPSRPSSPRPFTGSTTYDALNRPSRSPRRRQRLPPAASTKPTCSRESDCQPARRRQRRPPFVTNIDYDAKGQRDADRVRQRRQHRATSTTR